MPYGTPELSEFGMSVGDRFLLCTGGFWEGVTTDTILDALRQHSPLKAVNALTRLTGRRNTIMIVADVVHEGAHTENSMRTGAAAKYPKYAPRR